jgi:hypothetical protein
MSLPRVRALAVVAALAALATGCSGDADETRETRETAEPTPTFAVPHALPGLGAAAVVDGRVDPARSLATVVPAPERAEGDVPPARGQACNKRSEDTSTTGCLFGDPEGDYDVAVVGNSKTLQWLPALEQVALLNGWRLSVHTKTMCELTTAATRMNDREVYPECDTFNRRMLDRLVKERPDLVVTALDARKLRLTKREASADEVDRVRVRGVQRAWRTLTDAGIRVAVVAASPRLPMDVPECLEDHRSRPAACDVPRAAAYEDVWDTAAGERAAAQVAGTTYIDLNPWICPGDTCTTVIGGVVVYRDGHHLTRTYVETLAPRLARGLERATRADLPS